MIVIATNNGKLYLKRLFNSISNHNINEKVLIVDTGSTDEDHLNYLKELEKKDNVEVTQTPYKCYDTGAYIWAYNNFTADVYHFMHDSIEIKDPEFLQKVNTELKDADVVSYITFNFAGYGDKDWQDFLIKNIGHYDYKIGIFGPMFSIKKESLNKLPIEKLSLPINKNQQTAFEGIWPEFFTQHNMSIKSLAEHDHSHIINDGYPHIKKTLLIRQ